MNRAGLPKGAHGQRIGLLGGSFDPAHAGHLHITRVALKRFALDRVWWMVSPGNPLKAGDPQPKSKRMATAHALARDRRIVVTDIETRMGTRHTARTLEVLLPLYPGVEFVWLMGADNLAGFHHWRDWQAIAQMVPIGVLARPGQALAALNSPTARRFRAARLTASDAGLLASCAPPAWCYVALPMRPDSSSDLRDRGVWPAT